jgi:hypothetical protein
MPLAEETSSGRSICQGFYKTNWGPRRYWYFRGKTFFSNSSAPYHQFQHRRSAFDSVAIISIESLNRLAIAWVQHFIWIMVKGKMEWIFAESWPN